MSASPFRSHLLQQWARSGQSRPPMAVVPWLRGSGSTAEPSSQGEQHRSRRHHHSRGRHHSGEGPSLSSVDTASHAGSASSRWSHEAHSSSPESSPSRATRFLSSPVNSASADSPPISESLDFSDSDASESESLISTTQLAGDLQSLLKNRRTATRWDTSSDTNLNSNSRLYPALDRAIECAQMAPNHKRTEPFSFYRFVSSSQAAQQLAEIAYHVTLNKSNSVPNAKSKRQKWLDIPAFLVALVHNNQDPVVIEDAGGDDSGSVYRMLPYSPPATERQLEDYAATCAAVQNVLLSLHAEGIGSKWATGPVIHTPAFRNLVKAMPTDRVAALIMVGGSVEFTSEREEHITEARRHRRRRIQGGLVNDLE